MTEKLDEGSIRQLAELYGEPAIWTREFTARSPGFAGWVRRLVKRDGEVVLIVPRPNGRVLLHTKPYYPGGVHRLPTGGIRPGERPDDAARREAFEELGFQPKKLVFIGVLQNRIWVNGSGLLYPSFVFKTEEMSGAPQPTDPDEPISGYSEVEVEELEKVARQLRELPEDWREWGEFRAALHEILGEALGRV